MIILKIDNILVNLTKKSLKISIQISQSKMKKGYVASERAYGMPKHMIYVGAAWTMIWKGHKAQETENYAINTNFVK